MIAPVERRKLANHATTVSRDWKFAKTWLYQELRGEQRLTP